MFSLLPTYLKDEEKTDTVYNKLNNKEVDVFNVDLVIEGKQNSVINTQPTAGNHETEIAANQETRINGDAVIIDNETIDATDGVAGEANVSKSVDNLASRHMQVKDMEIDILKGGTSNEYIVMDRLDDTRILKLKAKSMEFDIAKE